MRRQIPAKILDIHQLRRVIRRNRSNIQLVQLRVDGLGGGLFHELDAGSLGIGASHTVGLAFGSLDDQEDAAVVGEAWSSLKVKVSPWQTMVAPEGWPVLLECRCTVSGQPALRCIRREMPKKP